MNNALLKQLLLCGLPQRATLMKFKNEIMAELPTNFKEGLKLRCLSRLLLYYAQEREGSDSRELYVPHEYVTEIMHFFHGTPSVFDLLDVGRVCKLGGRSEEHIAEEATAQFNDLMELCERLESVKTPMCDCGVEQVTSLDPCIPLFSNFDTDKRPQLRGYLYACRICKKEYFHSH